MAARIRCTTLFDITATGVRNTTRDDTDPRPRNQQRNWDTMNQIMSLRTLPEDISQPRHQGDHWCFEFSVPDITALGHPGDALALIRRDSQGVPMITGLDESPGLGPHLMPDQNLWFEVLTP